MFEIVKNIKVAFGKPIKSTEKGEKRKKTPAPPPIEVPCKKTLQGFQPNATVFVVMT